MAIKRRVVRTQRAEYAGGSRAKGWYAYKLQGIEDSGVRKQYFEIEGENQPTTAEAIQAAWKAAREWVAEKGEVVKTEGEYSVIY